MKKNNLYIGILYIVVGGIALFFTSRIDGSLGSMLFGFSIGGITYRFIGYLSMDSFNLYVCNWNYYI
jgi:hypothetical protein